MKFLIYKLYRMALYQESTVNPVIGFLGLVSIFELFHIVILFTLIEDVFKIKLEASNFLNHYFGWLFVVVGLSLNYLIFIKSRLIYRINEYYHEKKYSVWKGNLIFFGYIVFLFLIMLIQTWYYQKYKI